ncbi:SWI/SNF and RSC complexes subunit ssr3, partial [Lachnellula cervina]
MVGPHPQNQLTAAQMQAQQAAQAQASDRAKLRSRKPTDKNMPDGVEECIIGDGAQRYRDLREVERRLDATMTRKRLDLQDSVNRNVKRYRTLRVWVSNTVEDQPWQADTLDVDAFDFSTNMDSSYRVKIEGRLLDADDEYLDSDDSDDEDGDTEMAEDGQEKKKKDKAPTKKYKLSHFFKAMTVDFDNRNKAKDGADQSVEWKKPVVAANSANLPNAADFDQLEFKRGGDDNINITINLVRDENPERYTVSPALAEILDTREATRAEAVMGIYEYIKANGLQEDDEKRSFDCDDRLKAVWKHFLMQVYRGGEVNKYDSQVLSREKGYIPYLPDVVMQHMTSLEPVKLPYTIRVDKEFHENPQPTIYDVQVLVDDPLRAALMSYLQNPTYAQNLLDIADLNERVAVLIQKIGNSKSKHGFFDALSKNPTEFIARWLSSQKRDLDIMSGEAARGVSEDAKGDEWRRGGKDGIWGSENVRESVNLIVGAKNQPVLAHRSSQIFNCFQYTRSSSHSQTQTQTQSYPTIPPPELTLPARRQREKMSSPAPHPVFSPSNLAVITGGASGIGLALAQKCASYGMNVLICDINAANLKAAKEIVKGKGKVETVELDVSKLEEYEKVKSVVEKEFNGRISLLALNAGTTARGTWGDSAYFARILNTNLFGVINGLNTLLPLATAHSTASNPTSIIITGSKQGITNPPGNPAYNASKAAVRTLAEQLSFDLSRSTPTTSVHLLVPGWTFTGMTGSSTSTSVGEVAQREKEKEKPEGAWTAEQVVEYLEARMGEGKFYVICPDNDVSESVDRKRIAWATNDLLTGRPPLTRWREDYAKEAEEWMAGQD